MEYVIICLLGLCVVLLALLLKRTKNANSDDTKSAIDKLSGDFEIEKNLSKERIEKLNKDVADGNDKINKAISENNEKMLKWQSDYSDRMNRSLKESIGELQQSNEKKLDEMRNTVNEKLDTTLNQRLDSSFKNVSEQLQKLYESLGEMKNLSSGVSDLQRLLTNVKARGTWAEVQLGELLEQFLTADQFERNVSIKKNSERVEFAIKIPSRSDNMEYHYLPIDSKFPQEDYLRLQEASQKADAEGVEKCRKELEKIIKNEAKTIADLYIDVPTTTDFAIMFLPTEGLYAEVLRMPGLCEDIQNRLHIMICGPTTIAAFLQTVKVGFRTIALDKRAAEVWQILGAAKQQYETFGTVLEKAKKKINEAGNVIDDAQHRNSIINKKLKSVESLEPTKSEVVLGLNENYFDEPATGDDE